VILELLLSNRESPRHEEERVQMAKFDYEHARQEISKINGIVETCPEAVKEKCFELLFAAVFDTKPRAAEGGEVAHSKQHEKPDPQQDDPPKQKKSCHRTFLRSCIGITCQPKISKSCSC
jgi:hypothetical protein